MALALQALVLAPLQADPLAIAAPMAARAPKALLVALAPAGKRIVAAGERGIVLLSDDAGRHWQQAAVPVSVNLTALHFADALHGWAAGHDGVLLATVDGGKRWTKQLDGYALNTMLKAEAISALARERTPATENTLADVEAGMASGPSRPLLSIWFSDARSGYAVGAFGLALRTRDGGAHWDNMASRMDNPDGLHLNWIGAGSGHELLAAGEGGRIYRSRDLGDHWETVATAYQGHLYGVLSLGGDALLAYGFGGHLLRSDDGKAWRELASGTRKSVLKAWRALDGAVLALAKDGTILRSTDDGRSFTVATAGQGLELAAVLPDAALAAGVGGIHNLKGPL